MADLGLLAGAGVAAVVAGLSLGAGLRTLSTARLVGGAPSASLDELSGTPGTVLVEGDVAVDTPAPDPFPDETDRDTALLRWHHEEGIDRVHAAGVSSGRVAIDDGTGLAVLDADWLRSELAVSPDEPSSRSLTEDQPFLEVGGREWVQEWDVQDALPADLSAFLEARGVDPHPYRSQEFRYRRVLDADPVVVVAEFTDEDGRPRLRGTDETPMLLASGEAAGYTSRLRAKTWGLLGVSVASAVAAVALAATGLALI